MPSFSARRLLRGLAALTLVVGAFGLQACGAAEGADDCQDCGPSTCTAPTACTNRGVELEVQKIFSSDEAPPIMPLRIVVSFEQHAVAFSFDGALSRSAATPWGPCRAVASGELSPELCEVSPAGSLRVWARSDMLRDYDEQAYAVGVSIEDGEGEVLFSDRRTIALDPIWAPGCRPYVDPAYCGQAYVALTR